MRQQNNLVYLVNDVEPGTLFKPVLVVKTVWCNSGACWANKKCADCVL